MKRISKYHPVLVTVVHTSPSDPDYLHRVNLLEGGLFGSVIDGCHWLPWFQDDGTNSTTLAAGGFVYLILL